MKNIKLTIEMIPSTLWNANLREFLTKTSWDKVRKESYDKADNKCEICGGQGVYGRGHPVECHELWSYDDDNYIQKLEGVVSLCVLCHRVKHFGLSSLRGYREQCIKHMMKVNEWDRHEVINYIEMENELHKNRSNYDWNIDLSWVNDKSLNFKKKYRLIKS